MVSHRQTPLLKKILLIVLFVSVIFAGLMVSPTFAQGGIDEWLAFGPGAEGKVPEVELISASYEAIELQAIMPGARFGETNIAGQTYLTLSGEGYTFNDLVIAAEKITRASKRPVSTLQNSEMMFYCIFFHMH